MELRDKTYLDPNGGCLSDNASHFFLISLKDLSRDFMYFSSNIVFVGLLPRVGMSSAAKSLAACA